MDSLANSEDSYEMPNICGISSGSILFDKIQSSES